jgi:hypothetical protein
LHLTISTRRSRAKTLQAVRKWKVPQGYDAGNLEEKLQGVATSINLSRSSTSLSSPAIVAPIGWGHFPPAPCGRVNDGVIGQPVRMIQFSPDFHYIFRLSRLTTRVSH